MFDINRIKLFAEVRELRVPPGRSAFEYINFMIQNRETVLLVDLVQPSNSVRYFIYFVTSASHIMIRQPTAYINCKKCVLKGIIWALCKFKSTV